MLFEYPEMTPDNHEDLLKLLPVVFKKDGEQEKRYFGFGLNQKVDLDREFIWLVRFDRSVAMCTTTTEDELLRSPFERIFRSKNLLELIHWLEDNHPGQGTHWRLQSPHYGYPYFDRPARQISDLSEVVEVILSGRRSVVVDTNHFDDTELVSCEKQEMKFGDRSVFAYLVPHPMGGELLLYTWTHMLYEEKMTISLRPPRIRKPRAPDAPPPPDPVAVVCRRFQMALEKQINALPYFRNVGGYADVSGMDIPSKCREILKAIQFLQDHKYWGKSLPIVRAHGKKFLESIENKMVLRSDTNVRDLVLAMCTMTKMKIKPFKERSAPKLVEFMPV